MNEQITHTDQKRRFWQFPWKYRESFLISIGLIIIGFVIELASAHKGISMPVWPANLFILAIFVAYVVAFHFLVKHPIKKWLSSVPAAISAISVLTFMVLLMGFVKQGDEGGDSLIYKLGLTHVATSWPYLLSSLYLMLVLGFTIVRRFTPFSVRNAAFALNHLGLWIVLAAASLGASDSQKLSMVLEQDKMTFIAFDDQNQVCDVDFGLKLLKFKMEEYPPNIGIMDEKGKLVHSADSFMEVKAGNKGNLLNWHVEIKEFVECGHKDSTGFVASEDYGGPPAALISARNLATGETVTGWVTSGSPYVFTEFLPLNDKYSIAMTMSTPKKYQSDITAYYGNQSENMTVEVNKPQEVNGWKIYQTSYDEDLGKWSKTSIVQIIKDPWLPYVYIGIFMILAGALYLFWTGSSKSSTTKK
jgi:hypothetical protein